MESSNSDPNTFNAPKLAIFKKFKTKKGDLTGEALRQRSIIAILATEQRFVMNTRTSIAHKVAEKSNTVWQNVYSGIFRDLDEILIPLRIVEEAGRLPLKRGPKVLQELGIPYYKLTESGMLVASALEELKDERIQILEKFFDNFSRNDNQFKEAILILLKVAPNFVFNLIRNHVQAYVDKKIQSIVPFDQESLRNTIDESMITYLELIKGFSSLDASKQETIVNFLHSNLPSKH